MASVNKVFLIGRLGRDPEVKYTQAGKAVANMRLATGESWTDQATGEKKESTDWHTVVAFGKTAELAGQYLAKGRQVCVEGKLRVREYEDRDKNKRTSIEVHADNITFLGERGGGGDEQPSRERPAPARGGGRGSQNSDDSLPF